MKRLREDQRLTFVELADRLSKIGRPIPVLGLRRIERGERRVDVDDLFSLAEVLGVEPIALLYDEDPYAELRKVTFLLAAATQTGTHALSAVARIFNRRLLPNEDLIRLAGLSLTGRDHAHPQPARGGVVST